LSGLDPDHIGKSTLSNRLKNLGHVAVASVGDNGCGTKVLSEQRVDLLEGGDPPLLEKCNARQDM
jgi:hypothetical protein